jgi:hypothetical protein
VDTVFHVGCSLVVLDCLYDYIIAKIGVNQESKLWSTLDLGVVIAITLL